MRALQELSGVPYGREPKPLAYSHVSEPSWKGPPASIKPSDSPRTGSVTTVPSGQTLHELSFAAAISFHKLGSLQ